MNKFASVNQKHLSLDRDFNDMIENVRWTSDCANLSYPSIDKTQNSISSKVLKIKSIDEYLEYARKEYEKFSEVGVNVKFKHEPCDLESVKNSLIKSMDVDEFNSDRSKIALCLIETMEQRISSFWGSNNKAAKNFLKSQYKQAQEGAITAQGFEGLVLLAKSDPNNFVDEMGVSDSYLDALSKDEYLSTENVVNTDKNFRDDLAKPAEKVSVVSRLKEKFDAFGELLISKSIDLYKTSFDKSITDAGINKVDDYSIEDSDFESISTAVEDRYHDIDSGSCVPEPDLDNKNLDKELELALQPRMPYHV